MKNKTIFYNINTNDARELWHQINNYFFMCDDPRYSKLHQFRNKILAIPNKKDREELTIYFEKEAGNKINYYESPY